jgi:hypothetical protein
LGWFIDLSVQALRDAAEQNGKQRGTEAGPSSSDHGGFTPCAETW